MKIFGLANKKETNSERLIIDVREAKNHAPWLSHMLYMVLTEILFNVSPFQCWKLHIHSFLKIKMCSWEINLCWLASSITYTLLLVHPELRHISTWVNVYKVHQTKTKDFNCEHTYPMPLLVSQINNQQFTVIYISKIAALHAHCVCYQSKGVKSQQNGCFCWQWLHAKWSQRTVEYKSYPE